MTKNIFVITSIVSFCVVVACSILLLTRKAGGFSLFSSDNSCTPYNVFVSKGAEDYSVVVEWYTKGKCVGFVRYGKDMNSMENISLDSLGGNRGNFHRVVIDKVVTSKKYYYLIISGEQSYGNNGSPLEFVLDEL
jgi:hypothetical protein